MILLGLTNPPKAARWQPQDISSVEEWEEEILKWVVWRAALMVPAPPLQDQGTRSLSVLSKISEGLSLLLLSTRDQLSLWGKYAAGQYAAGQFSLYWIFSEGPLLPSAFQLPYGHGSASPSPVNQLPRNFHPGGCSSVPLTKRVMETLMECWPAWALPTCFHWGQEVLVFALLQVIIYKINSELD